MVENKKLILNCAKNIKKIGGDFLRGGAFKPLTFPYRSKKYTETRDVDISSYKFISHINAGDSEPLAIFFFLVSLLIFLKVVNYYLTEWLKRRAF